MLRAKVLEKLTGKGKAITYHSLADLSAIRPPLQGRQSALSNVDSGSANLYRPLTKIFPDICSIW